jgi:TP53 regulating kinase and related kinases
VDLDKSLTKKRTKNEEKILKKAASIGVHVPQVYKYDLDNGVLIIEFINESQTVRDYLIELATNLNTNDIEVILNEISSEIGKYIGILHKNDIIHGDLTTSNILMKREPLSAKFNYIFIDFGLSFVSSKLDDKAVDLYVLEKALLSTHSQYAKKLLDNIMLSYADSYESGHAKVQEQLELVRQRGRKRSMVG